MMKPRRLPRLNQDTNPTNPTLNKITVPKISQAPPKSKTVKTSIPILPFPQKSQSSPVIKDPIPKKI